jgi:succinoglycan biosynthesis protein ExoM
MTASIPHITVCICTFKRPVLLKRLLDALACLKSEGAFTFSVVVADNDRERSAEPVVRDFSTASALQVTYCSEPRQNIALARNKTLEHSEGDYIAFIDDDEYPGAEWLLKLLDASRQHGADGVLGPVRPHFEEAPPRWAVRGGFFERPRHATGYRIDLKEARTGNLLFSRRIIEGVVPVFQEQFGTGGEDVDFFRRMMGQGRVFIWCDEAPVFESVPPSRCNRRYLLRRGLLRGRSNFNNPKVRVRKLAISALAIPLYALALPVCLLLGQHVFLRYMIKLYDHAGRFLTMFGLNPVKDRDM